MDDIREGRRGFWINFVWVSSGYCYRGPGPTCLVGLMMAGIRLPGRNHPAGVAKKEIGEGILEMQIDKVFYLLHILVGVAVVDFGKK